MCKCIASRGCFTKFGRSTSLKSLEFPQFYEWGDILLSWLLLPQLQYNTLQTVLIVVASTAIQYTSEFTSYMCKSHVAHVPATIDGTNAEPPVDYLKNKYWWLFPQENSHRWHRQGFFIRNCKRDVRGAVMGQLNLFMSLCSSCQNDVLCEGYPVCSSGRYGTDYRRLVCSWGRYGTDYRCNLAKVSSSIEWARFSSPWGSIQTCKIPVIYQLLRLQSDAL